MTATLDPIFEASLKARRIYTHPNLAHLSDIGLSRLTPEEWDRCRVLCDRAGLVLNELRLSFEAAYQVVPQGTASDDIPAVLRSKVRLESEAFASFYDYTVGQVEYVLSRKQAKQG